MRRQRDLVVEIDVYLSVWRFLWQEGCRYRQDPRLVDRANGRILPLFPGLFFLLALRVKCVRFVFRRWFTFDPSLFATGAIGNVTNCRRCGRGRARTGPSDLTPIEGGACHWYVCRTIDTIKVGTFRLGRVVANERVNVDDFFSSITCRPFVLVERRAVVVLLVFFQV